MVVAVSILLAASGMSWAALSDIAGNPHRVAIERMVELGVLEGRGDGRFWPLDNLNRAEAAKVAAYLSGYTLADAEQARHHRVFDDVYVGMGAHEWAVGWINLIAHEGIILGYGDGKYHPGDGLNMAQWVTILIRILGHEEGGMAWPGDYALLGHQLGLTTGLTYQNYALVNRGEMARFSATAVDDVERADGTRILDTLLAMRDGDGGDEDPDDPAIYVTAQMSPEFVPAGGGRTVTITVTVNDGSGAPIEGANVDFFAGSDAGVRLQQLSATQTETDAAGRVVVTYTTVAADNQRQVRINVHVDAEGITADRSLAVMAANSAARVTGIVTAPYTGTPAPGLTVHFWDPALERMAADATTDAQGRYAAIVPTGDYDVFFELSARDTFTLKATAHGATYTLDYDKGVLRGRALGLAAGAEIYAYPLSYAYDRHDRSNFTFLGSVGGDGSFTIYLRPGTYDLSVLGREDAFMRVGVEQGQVTDVGTVTP